MRNIMLVVTLITSFSSCELFSPAPKDVSFVVYTTNPSYVGPGYALFIGITNLESYEYTAVNSEINCYYTSGAPDCLADVDSCAANSYSFAKFIIHDVTEPVDLELHYLTPILYGTGWDGYLTVTIDPDKTCESLEIY